MVNQWGRDGNFASGSAGSARSSGSVVIPAIIALIIGAGGGYAGARFFSGVSTSDLAARDQKIVELNQTLSELQFDTQGADTQQAALRNRVKDLEAQIVQLKRTKDSLKTYADEQASKASDDAKAEIAALKKTIEDAGDLSGQLNRARKSMKVSELQIIELENTIRDQKAEIAKLQAAIDQNANRADPVVALLKQQKRDLEAQVASLRDQLAKRAAGADAEATQQIAALQQQKDALQTKLDAALKSVGNAGQQAEKIATLQGQLDEMAGSLADRDAAARAASSDLKQARADLATSQKQLKAVQDQNQVLSDGQDALQTQVAKLKATIAELESAGKPADNQPSANDDQNAAGQSDAGLTPRNRDDVERAVQDLPGYDALGVDKQQTLVSALVKGECVTDALKAAYGHVSPIALRRLFRDLGGRC